VVTYRICTCNQNRPSSTFDIVEEPAFLLIMSLFMFVLPQKLMGEGFILAMMTVAQLGGSQIGG
jgi:hypothetical protein